VLSQKAREVAARLGYVDVPVDDSFAWNYRTDYHDWAERNLKAEEYREQVRRGQPALIYFSFRQSPQYLEPRDTGGRPTEDDPPMNVPGMVRVEMDPEGRLTRFLGVPPQHDSGQTSTSVNWITLFDAAGLDQSRWTETRALELPPVGFDERKAWTGTYAHASEVPLRIEAAAWKGRPVSFELFGPWREPVRMPRLTPTQARLAIIVYAVISFLLLGAGWLAWRNYGAGRGDVGGAVRLAAFGFAAQSLAGIVAIHHVPAPSEGVRLVDAIGKGLFVAATSGVLYLALEPFIRRRWPQSLISWTRLLAGHVRDPLVSGHILLATAFGVAVAILRNGVSWYEWQALARLPSNDNHIDLLDPGLTVSWVLTGLIQPAAIVMGLLFLFMFFRLLLRNTWAAAAVIAGLGVVLSVTGSGPVAGVVAAVHLSLLLWLILRFGILPGTLFLLISGLMHASPLTSDVSAWYASRGLIIVALTLVLAVWSFRKALGGRKVLREGLLDA
jgi:serine/threonine-protein kinase